MRDPEIRFDLGDPGPDLGGMLIKLILIVVALLLLGSFFGSCSNRIKDDEAVARFEELAQTDDVVIERRSNSSFLFGNPHKVTYELRVNGEPKSGECTSGSFSAMVCTLFTPTK